MKKKKNLLMASGITLMLFSFIFFLIYIIYCFVFYDRSVKNDYVSYYNRGQFKNIYKNMVFESGVNEKDFDRVILNMYDKDNLNKLYVDYFKNSDFSSLDDFLYYFYYGDKDITRNDIEYFESGKNSFKKRKKIKIKGINVKSQSGEKSVLKEVKNVKFKIKDEGSLIIDSEIVNCEGDVCSFPSIFGGIHTLRYYINGENYYGLVNLNADDMEIDVMDIPHLVNLNKKEVNIDDSTSLTLGTYQVKTCFYSSGCPDKKKSYMTLNDDGTVYYYIYINLEIASDTYLGTYKIENGFLYLNFYTHSYKAHDYDTGVNSSIRADLDIPMTYKIINNKEFINSDLAFILK